ncbi:hypothetical protein JCM16106_20190 [Hydrogenophilus islandicus]
MDCWSAGQGKTTIRRDATDSEVIHQRCVAPPPARNRPVERPRILPRHYPRRALASVAEYLKADGSRLEHYYRPLNEATALFSPADGVIEVFSARPAVRQQLARAFAEVSHFACKRCAYRRRCWGDEG